MKKVRKAFFKQAEGEQPAGEADDKHKQFYESLFQKEEAQAPSKKPKKKQGTFNKGLDRLKQSTEQAKDEKAKRQQNLEKAYRQKRRYAHQLNRRTEKGQLRMSGLIGHYLSKIEKDQ